MVGFWQRSYAEKRPQRPEDFEVIALPLGIDSIVRGAPI